MGLRGCRKQRCTVPGDLAGGPERSQNNQAACQRPLDSYFQSRRAKVEAMPVPQLLNDVVQVLLQLAPAASLVSLVLAGISLRREGGTTFLVSGSFTKWMFWAVVFVTLVPLLGWFNSFGVSSSVSSAEIGSSWLASFASDVSNFVTDFIAGRIVTTLAAFLVLRAILDAASGEHPLPSIVAAMFLLGAQTTYSLIESYNTGTQFATADVLDSLWNYLASTIMPIASGLAVAGAIINFATRRPAMRLVAVALAMLCVSGIWKLVVSMEG
jgi:hypothetical protein